MLADRPSRALTDAQIERIRSFSRTQEEGKARFTPGRAAGSGPFIPASQAFAPVWMPSQDRPDAGALRVIREA